MSKRKMELLLGFSIYLMSAGTVLCLGSLVASKLGFSREALLIPGVICGVLGLASTSFFAGMLGLYDKKKK